MPVIHWTEIQLLNNVRKYVKACPEILNGNSVVTYKSKVKLHGSCCAVQCLADGTIVPQSRTAILSTTDDYAGFAKWVKEHEAKWKDNEDGARSQMIIFGEWIGKGIQSGVAAGEIPKKSFAVFAARNLGEDGSLVGEYLYTEPYFLTEIVRGIPDTYVIPWYKSPDDSLVSLSIDWSDTDEMLTPTVDLINRQVSMVEANDPWVESVFGIKGTGEGLVFYPTSPEHVGATNYTNLSFKAKGEKHRVLKAAAPAQLNADVAASVDAFVTMVLTVARCDQGVSNVGLDMKNTGKFVAWMLADVEKEAQDELEAAKLDWKQVQKALTDKARTWYLSATKTRDLPSTRVEIKK